MGVGVQRERLICVTQESGQLTPTMKIRRAIVEREFGDAIDAMYAAPRQPTG